MTIQDAVFDYLVETIPKSLVSKALRRDECVYDIIFLDIVQLLYSMIIVGDSSARLHSKWNPTLVFPYANPEFPDNLLHIVCK